MTHPVWPTLLVAALAAAGTAVFARGGDPAAPPTSRLTIAPAVPPIVIDGAFDDWAGVPVATRIEKHASPAA